MIRNIIKGWWNWLFNKEKDLYKSRMEVCNKCEHNITLQDIKICNQCGCVLAAKTRVKDEKCIIGKW